MKIMEADPDVKMYIRATIKRKLQELGPSVDEELIDYIMVLVANKKNAHKMAEDLSLFLGRNSVKFSLWLQGVLQKLCAVAVDPGSLRPQCFQADLCVSFGNGPKLGHVDRGGDESLAPTLSSIRSNSPDAPLFVSPTRAHHRKGCRVNSMHHVLHTAQPPMGLLYSSAGSCMEAFAAASMSRPDLEGGVAAPGGFGWPSKGSEHHGSLCQVPDAMHGYWASEAPGAVDQQQCGYIRLQDGCPARDKVARAGKDWGAREEVMFWRREHQTVSSIEHMRGNADPEVGGSSDAHDFISRKPPVGGSVRSRLAATVEEDVLVPTTQVVQGRRDQGKSGSLSPRFIVTLDGAPSPLRNLEDDDGGGDESELYCSDGENDSVGAKRRKVPERCKFWPACENGDKCSYHHPTTQCKSFPHCTFGDKCLFIHPKCKYNGQCTRVDCPYVHNKKRSLTSSSKPEAKMPSDLCHFFPECKKMDCQFYHPKPCRFTTRCKRANCYFYHPPVLTGHTQVGVIAKQLNG